MALARVDWITDKNEVCHPSQKGFGKHLGTQDSLTLLREHILGTHVNEEQVTALRKQQRILLAVDIKKTFDTLPHATVLDTMSRLGVQGQPLNFGKAFLQSRRYVIKLGKHESHEKRKDVGLPQGVGLLPTLFHLAMAPLLWSWVRSAIWRIRCTPMSSPCG